MKLTNHASRRSQQRGISTPQIQLVAAFGRPIRTKGGAVSYHLDKHGLRDLEAVLKQGVQLLDKLKHTKIICSDDQPQVITCYHTTELF